MGPYQYAAANGLEVVGGVAVHFSGIDGWEYADTEATQSLYDEWDDEDEADVTDSVNVENSRSAAAVDEKTAEKSESTVDTSNAEQEVSTAEAETTTAEAAKKTEKAGSAQETEKERLYYGLPAPVRICGELGAETDLTKDFLKMGIDELSVSPGYTLELRKRIREC